MKKSILFVIAVALSLPLIVVGCSSNQPEQSASQPEIKSEEPAETMPEPKAEEPVETMPEDVPEITVDNDEKHPTVRAFLESPEGKEMLEEIAGSEEGMDIAIRADGDDIIVFSYTLNAELSAAMSADILDGVLEQLAPAYAAIIDMLSYGIDQPDLKIAVEYIDNNNSLISSKTFTK